VPRDRRREILFLDADQVLDLADAIDPRSRLLVLVLAYPGLRWGEAAALRRGRVDLLRRRLDVWNRWPRWPADSTSAPPRLTRSAG
jgi:integrase